VVLGLAGVGLVLVGYGIGRWQDSPATVPVAAPAVSSGGSAPPAGGSAPPSVDSAPPSSDAPAPTVYPTLQAEDANGNNGTQTEDTADTGGGKDVGYIADGDSLRFDNFDFGAVPPTKVEVRVASDAGDGGRMDIRLDGPDQPPIGTLRVTRTGGWQNWRTDEVTLTPTTGVHTIYLTFSRDDDDEFVNINWLLFSS
jgi:hypothetical protein